MDGHRLAGDDGGRDPQRHAAARAPALARSRSKRPRETLRQHGAPLPTTRFQRIAEKRACGARTVTRGVTNRERDHGHEARPRRERRVASELDRTLERGSRAPARAPEAGRLVGRRARVERDHDGPAPAAARVPAPSRRGHDAPLRERAARPAASGRALVDLLGRRARPDRDPRVVRGASTRRALGRRRAPQLPRRRFCEERGGHRRRACLHAHLARPVRALAVGRDPAASARAGPAQARRFRSPSTTSPAGRARPSSRSRSSCTTARFARCRPSAPATSSNLGPVARKADGWAAQRPGARAGTPGRASSPAASGRSLSRSAGSSTGRSSTAPGAASSRRGSGR